LETGFRQPGSRLGTAAGQPDAPTVLGASGDRDRAAALTAVGLAEAEQLGMAREIVRLQRLGERL